MDNKTRNREPIPEVLTVTTPSVAVVEAVAEATGQSALEMEPLAHAIDPDALNALLGTGDGEGHAVTVVFEYGGREVVVSPDGIRVSP